MRSDRWLPWAPALLAAVLYLPTFGFGFVFDDEHLIVNNAFLREPWSPLRAFAHDFWHGTSFGAAYYRPVVTATFALNGRVLGWGPAGFHLVNLLIHALNAALCFLLARRLGTGRGGALVAAGLFAAHPAAAWAVSSVVARGDLLAATFVMLAWLAYAAWRDQEAPWAGRMNLLAVMASVLSLAILSKESAIGFLILPLLGLRDSGMSASGAGSPARRFVARAAAPSAALAGLAAALTLRAFAGVAIAPARGAIDPLVNPVSTLSGVPRIGAALELTWRYLAYVVWPLNFSDPQAYSPPGGPPTLTALAVAAFLALAGLGVIILWWRGDRAAEPLAFAAATFLPASNLLVPISSLYALNFLYMPMTGVAIAAGCIVTRIAPRRRIRLASAAAMLLGVGALGALTVAESAIWRDGETLFESWTRRFPHYSIAHSRLGVARMSAGKSREALRPLRRSLEIDDRNLEAHYNLGVALVQSGEAETLPEALAHNLRAIELAPDFVQAHINASKISLLLDRAAAAEAHAREALRLAPGFAAARLNLGEALFRQERFRDAASEFEVVASVWPQDPAILSPLIVSLLKAGRLDDARRAAERARVLHPGMAWFDFCLARIEVKAGNHHRAMELLKAAAHDPEARVWVSQVAEFEALKDDPEFPLRD